ncbi:MAG TPA: dihydropteroate synthase [Ruminococcaceae bacterium]|nr:dihydropteroate synthase [Oscillospiraceae bacterium]
MEFSCKDYKFPLGSGCYVMGILNITPDSFSDGGLYAEPESAVKRALQIENEGAGLLDIGAQSTRPGHTPLSAREEIARLKAALPEIIRRVRIPVSVDTFYPETAVFAAENGAHIINDVSGAVSSAMAEIIREYELGWVIMHAAEVSGPGLCGEVHGWLESAAKKACALGVPANQICLDPGLGFGKDAAGCLLLIKNTARVKVSGFAYLVGGSRKRFIGECCGNPPFDQRDAGSIAAHTAAILSGADFIRVHAVKEAVQAAKVANALLASK